MDKLPTELFTDFLFNIDDLGTLAKFCRSNRMAMHLCRLYKEKLCERFLKIYKVEYDDPTNFIYVMNKVSKEDYFINGKPDVCRIMELYSKFFDKKEIVIHEDWKMGPHEFSLINVVDMYPRQFTSMPLYPNLKSLDCSYVRSLQSLPDGLLNLETLKCVGCSFTSLPFYPKLKSLSCTYVRSLRSLPDGMLNLESLNCHACFVKSLPKGMTSLKTFYL